MAIDRNNVKIVQALLRSPEVDVNGSAVEPYSPLFLGCKEGKLDVVKALLVHCNIQVNKASKKNAVTPLMIAIGYNHRDVVAELLEHKDIDVNLQAKDGNFPLMVAVNNKQDCEILEMLLRHPKTQLIAGDGALTDLGQRALDYAVSEGNEQAEALIRAKL